MSYKVKFLRGPYDLKDEGYIGYDVEVDGQKLTIGEEPDGFRYLETNQYLTVWGLELYKKQGVKNAIAKAIEDHNIKRHLSKETGETFGDLLDIL
jgi:hypothetical protein